MALAVCVGCTPAGSQAQPEAPGVETAAPVASPSAFPTPSPVASPVPTEAELPSPEPALDPDDEASPTAGPDTGSAASSAAGPGTAAAMLAGLAIKGRAPMTGYDRDAFGQAWADVDRNGCDTRNDILRRDLVNQVIDPGTNGCVVLSGDAAPEVYTGADIRFVRGGASEIDIDHVVALADAWQSGAQQFEVRKRIAFANDPLNLLAVDASANRQKGAANAASWLPARKSFRCDYVARQVAVKAKYGLWATAPERDAIARVLDDCPGQAAPTGGGAVLAPAGLGVVKPAPAPEPDPAPAPKPAGSKTDPRFPYCKDAIPAGYGPYHRGVDPEYDWYRDADGDGVVCE